MKHYHINNEPADMNDIINMAKEEGYTSSNGIWLTSACAAYLRQKGYIVGNASDIKVSTIQKTNKYTQTPWTHNKLDKWNYITKNNSTALPDIIATIEQNGDDEDANACYIVKCVNSHDALTESCRQAIAALEEYAIKPLEEYERIDVIDFIKKSLSQAEAS